MTKAILISLHSFKFHFRENYQPKLKLSSFFFEFTALCQTSDNGTIPFGGFFHHESGAAYGTFSIEGLMPGCKGTLRKTAATIKCLTPFGFSLEDFTAAIDFRARHARTDARTIGI